MKGSVTLGRCEYCGDPLEQSPRGRDKKFCDAKCRKDRRDEIEEGRRDN